MIKLKRYLTKYLPLLLLLVLAAALRLYRLDTDLLFHRDQGLHSLSIWNIWHDKELSLLGPPSDVDGLYHSPAYYWLMLPSYGLSGGNPVVASAFQILLETFSLIFFFIAIKRLFDTKTAYFSLVLYAVSYGLISYSRWLVNVTPIFPFTNFLLYLLTFKNKRPWHPFLTSFLVGCMTQFDAAVGIFAFPFILYYYRRHFSLANLFLIFFGFLLPSLPLVLFELRHDFVITNAVRSFSSSSAGIGFSFRVVKNNAFTLLTEIKHLISYPYFYLSTFLFFAGLYQAFKKKTPFVISYLLIFFFSLSLFQRGAYGFFFATILPLTLAVTAFGLAKFPKFLAFSLLALLVTLNLKQLPNIYQPNNALIPIGDANVITIQDRKNIIDWIYQKADGQPFSFWTYNLPYYQEYVWDYLLLWYAEPKYGYLPEKTKDFSPGDLKTSRSFFAIYETDHDRPDAQKLWFDQIESNFGPLVDRLQSHDLYVQLRSFKPTKLQ